MKNELVHPDQFGWAYFKSVFTRVNQIQYSPVNTLYFSLVFRINGYDPYYYHISNLLVHFLNAMLIFRLAKRIVSIFNIGNGMLIAYIVSLLWCIHPLNVEPVTWVSGSKILLCTLFTLCSILCFLRALLLDKMIYYAGSAFLCILSFLCKELAILTPVMFCLITFCVYRGKVQYLKKIHWWFLAAMMAVSIILGVITAGINRMDTQEFAPMAGYSYGRRVLLIFYCISFYFGNLLTPLNLHYHYMYPIQPDGPIPVIFYLYPVFFAGLTALFCFFLRGSREFYFYLLCTGIFVIQIALYIQVIPMTRPAIVADRYMYLPSFALLLAGVQFISDKIAFNPQLRSGKLIASVLVAVYIGYFASYSHQLAKNWLSLDLR
ncbi:hypothetical protein [Chitinophaga sp. XS-30]|uniref:hypothetical protein n=1 Tax=Chitinophaga sp. XS-30 TaxID=2604421 RepID=UPI0011DD3F9D|nr:hypothetical protein [Chitinophaga sp. XS-30]QEH39726.1 hypothetical protein FW415_02145 [Chitinophaga sp. XS-30]